MKLGHDNSTYHHQMLYASIGWSVGAALGVALAIADGTKSKSEKTAVERMINSGNDSGGDGDGEVEAVPIDESQKTKKRVICVLGDGALQMTAPELSSFVRYGVPVLFIVSNNKSYAIEEKIHDGEYNNLQVWDYAKLADVFNGTDTCEEKISGSGTALGLRVEKGEDLEQALVAAQHHTTGPVILECSISPEDVSKQLMEFGPRLSAYTYR